MPRRIDRKDQDASILEARRIANSPEFSSSPIDLHAVGKLLGVTSIEPRAIGADGYVGPLSTGELAIRYREGNTEERNRFTIAHEFGHIILARVQGCSIGVKQRGTKSDYAEERTVDRIAAELLLPEALLTKLLCERTQKGENRWDSINALRHCFHVSTSTLALRILELPRLVSVLFRIREQSRGFQCSVTEGRDIQFLCPTAELADKLSRDKLRAAKHNILISLYGEKYDLILQGHERPLRAASGLTREYWCIGWTQLH